MWQCKKIRKHTRYVFLKGLSVFLSLLLALSAAEPQNESKSNQKGSSFSSSYALVIGIENYNNWPLLTRAVNDAVMVGNELEKMGFEVTYRSNLTLRELEQEFRTFFYAKKIDNNSRLFLWYSGHGHTLGGEGFLVPVDAPDKNDTNLKMKALPLRRFDELSRLTEARHVYMVFDSCFSTNIFDKESKDSPPITIALKNPVRQYLCSCSAGQNIRDNGTFRELFIDALRKEVEVDANKDNYLTAGEIGLFIEKQMTVIPGEKTRTPQYGKLRDFDKGDFVFFLESKSLDYLKDSLKDGGFGPEMIEIPFGSFNMGDLQGYGFGDEKPVHVVNISSIAVGRCEVTFEEYDRFCAATKYEKPDDVGWEGGKRPVIHVSWEDAKAYTKWLSEQTGYIYRLPTEAEWEYFARAGTDTNYWWGNEIGRNNAICDGCGAPWGWDADKSNSPCGVLQA